MKDRSPERFVLNPIINHLLLLRIAVEKLYQGTREDLATH